MDGRQCGGRRRAVVADLGVGPYRRFDFHLRWQGAELRDVGPGFRRAPHEPGAARGGRRVPLLR